VKEKETIIKNIKESIRNIIREYGANIFIFDTNVIMDFPNIFTYILDEKRQICVPNTVLEELDGIKDSADRNKSYKAREELKKIMEHIDSIKFEEPSTKNLPEGLDKSKNDNRILSIALHYKSNNPVIVTNDIGVLVKCKSQNILTWECPKDTNKLLSQNYA
jgi:predicted ribonuclease YlaK